MGRLDQRVPEAQDEVVFSRRQYFRYMKNYKVNLARKFGTYRINTETKDAIHATPGWRNPPFGIPIAGRPGYFKPVKYRFD